RGGRSIRHAPRDMLNRVKQKRLRPGETPGNPHSGGGPKNHVGTIPGIESAVDQRDRGLDNGIAQRAPFHPTLRGLTHRPDILLWHRAADDLVGEQKTLAAVARLDLKLHIGELTMAARLALEARVLKHLAFDRFLESNFWRSGRDLQIIICG